MDMEQRTAKAKRRLDELVSKLDAGVKDFYASDRYKEYIAAMSRFHQYSFGNAILIVRQCPAATRVAGYGTWQKLGRQVRRGEKGISILAPCPYKIEVEQEQPNALDKPAPKTILYFKVATVFDISQTEGRALPAIRPLDLSGEIEGFDGLFQRVASASPWPVSIQPIAGTAKGCADLTAKQIVIRSGMAQAQTLKTLIHEIAHAKLHARQPLPDVLETRRIWETEAESVAYVVCQHFGLDTADYSFAYIAGWAQGRELSELKSSLERIHAAAGEIIDAVQPPVQEQEPVLEQDNRERPASRHRRK